MSANYLLPAQTLLHLCADQPNSARLWADTVSIQQIRVSVISIAQAHASADLAPLPTTRNAIRHSLQRIIANVQAEGGSVLDIDLRVALEWQVLIHDPSLQSASQTERLVYATAIHHQFAIVEKAKPAHGFLTKMGVTVISL